MNTDIETATDKLETEMKRAGKMKDDLTDQERLDLQNHIGSALAVLYAATYRNHQGA